MTVNLTRTFSIRRYGIKLTTLKSREKSETTNNTCEHATVRPEAYDSAVAVLQGAYFQVPAGCAGGMDSQGSCCTAALTS